MVADFDANDLAEGLYAFRSKVSFYLTDEDPLPDYLATPLWQALHLAQEAIAELEKRHNCGENGLIDLGHGKDLK